MKKQKLTCWAQALLWTEMKNTKCPCLTCNKPEKEGCSSLSEKNSTGVEK